MIPDLVDIGGPWKVLPEGIHDSTLKELETVFANNPRRKELFEGLKKVIKSFSEAGCKILYIDGSYVTEKENPGDYDLCWESANVDLKKLDPVLLDFTNKRAAQKQKYLGECFPANVEAGLGKFFIDFFQTDRFTGKAKGIIRLKI